MSLLVVTSNENSILLLLFSLLLFLCSSLPTTKADPLYTICSTSPNYTVNSAFELNLKQLLQSLPSSTSISGFYNTSIANGSKDPVFGLGFCRGDISSVDCRSCIVNASLGIVKNCPNGKDATIFYELCQVRYSYQNFFSNMVYAGKYLNWTTSKQNELAPEQFTSSLMGLLGNISSQAASDPSNSLFATGETILTKTTILYGLGQCTKDIAKNPCYTCLRGSIGDLIGCCSSYTGGIIVSTSCNLRYELYRFYRVVQVAGRPPPPPPSKSTRRNRRKMNKSRVGIITAVSILAVVALFGFCLYYLRRTKGTQRVYLEDDGETSKPERGLLNDMRSPASVEFTSRNTQTQDDKKQMDNKDLPLMEFSTVKVATDDFSDSNKLGQGGFGIVYKGKLSDGNEIAVKRLSRKSWQGLGEFKNEIILIARLQHRNLVRLLGCSIDGEEKLLIYEFMPNISLDLFLFDQERRSEIGWETRFNIIIGIARGLLYLHEESRLKIIHRDLKPNNVLLDHEMNPKISDFGMARIFGENQSQANTKRVVGTCGYMAPEYAMEGIFSVKSDVYSFGVVLLEILSGKRSNGFYLTEHAQSLLAYAWHLWNERRSLDFIDSLLIESCPTEEVLRCLHIGLLCVQEDAADRPTMSSVVVMLSSNGSIELPQPTHPAFSVGRVITDEASSSINCSVNDLTISTVTPR